MQNVSKFETGYVKNKTHRGTPWACAVDKTDVMSSWKHAKEKKITLFISQMFRDSWQFSETRDKFSEPRGRQVDMAGFSQTTTVESEETQVENWSEHERVC